MQHGDYTSAPYYQYPPLQNPNPNPIPNATDTHQNPYASAPPFTISDYSLYSQSYPPYSLNPDPAPPTAPSYTPPPISSPNLQTFNPTPQPPSFPPLDPCALSTAASAAIVSSAIRSESIGSQLCHLPPQLPQP
ncbi:protein FREE1 isoform X1 [Prunus yedoensis var. nudiflora]|uniref:Protein FREE1 isoform X1 n=1 Tax=Prunus yedoensis var. nudiflora TaxID=2094558 RepID=A0A314UI09_PRUYE|nr:protein FREE1 isoform X1 [Prunus yedoensis var. nudiflora]